MKQQHSFCSNCATESARHYCKNCEAFQFCSRSCAREMEPEHLAVCVDQKNTDPNYWAEQVAGIIISSPSQEAELTDLISDLLDEPTKDTIQLAKLMVTDHLFSDEEKLLDIASERLEDPEEHARQIGIIVRGTPRKPRSVNVRRQLTKQLDRERLAVKTAQKRLKRLKERIADFEKFVREREEQIRNLEKDLEALGAAPSSDGKMKKERRRRKPDPAVRRTSSQDDIDPLYGPDSDDEPF